MKPLQTPDADAVNHSSLRDRFGLHPYRQRMNIQAYHAAKVIGQGRTLLHPENLPLLRQFIVFGLRATLLYGWARRNSRRIALNENHVYLRRLPAAFEEYRLLQLSDLHLDIDPGITGALAERLKDVEYDACVITGDYRAETWGATEEALAETKRVLELLRPPVYGILGNHDFLEMAPPLEEMGLRMLLNEHVALERGGDIIHLLGVDDPHFYETDDLEKCLKGTPLESTKILLSHSAELYRQAFALGIDLMLSGHTHGGQLCLPGGFAIMHNAHHPRYMSRGPWRYHDLLGYTATGVGCSLAPVRMFCPPEITVHVLHREKKLA